MSSCWGPCSGMGAVTSGSVSELRRPRPALWTLSSSPLLSKEESRTGEELLELLELSVTAVKRVKLSSLCLLRRSFSLLDWML